MVQWFKTLPSNEGGYTLILGQGAKILHVLWTKIQNIKQKQYCNKFNKDFKNDPREKFFKSYLFKIFITYKLKKWKFIVVKLGRLYLKQVIKININRGGQINIVESSYNVLRKTQYYFCGSPAKMCGLDLAMEKHQINKIWEQFTKITSLNSSKVTRSLKTMNE